MKTAQINYAKILITRWTTLNEGDRTFGLFSNTISGQTDEGFVNEL